MDGTRLERAEEIFHRLVDLPPHKRRSSLDGQCGSDLELKEFVLRLLESDAGGMGEFLRTPAVASGRMGGAVGADVHPTRVGPYSLVRQISEGGMGLVFEATQDRPRRTVALKLIKPGIASRHVVRRFQHEAEVLGQLQHVGIACIHEAGMAEVEYDNGVTARQPFFAMELIRGRSLTDYVRRNDCDLRRRLQLFVKICDAVHHAHQKGVIHRDLKPGNILVDLDGQPKILDFGVARLTDADLQTATLHTEVGQLIGTVQYMSPEQIAGDRKKLDTRSDVYSLGVILYELLSGKLPHDLRDRAIPEAARIIRDEEPTRLSTITPDFRGDLETITAKALEKDPDRRYGSASELGADICRFLDDRPIVARRAGTLYSFGKFARRHRAAVTGAAAAVAALLIGLTTTAWQAVRATAESRRATQEAAIQGEIANFLHDMLSSANPERARGRQVTVRDFLDASAEKLDATFAERPLVRAALHRTVGLAYRSVDDLTKAEAHLRAAFEIYHNELGPDTGRTITSASNLALVLKELGRLQEAEPIARAFLARAEAVFGASSSDAASLANILGTIVHAQGKDVESETLYRRTYRQSLELHGPDHPNTAFAMNNLGVWLLEQAQGDHAKLREARELLERCFALRRAHNGEDHPLTLSTALNLGWARLDSGDLEGGQALLSDTLKKAEQVLGPGHTTTLRCMQNLAVSHTRQGAWDEAERISRPAYERAVAALGEEHPVSIKSLGILANVVAMGHRFDEGLELAERCYQLAGDVYGKNHLETHRAATLFVDLYEQWGKPEEEKRWRDRLRGTPFEVDADGQEP